MKRHMMMPLTVLAVVAAGLAAVAPGSAWAQPDNDTFATATVIPSLPFSDTVETTDATTDADDTEVAAACGVQPLPATVWYTFTAPTDVTVLISTGSSSYPAAGAVVRGKPGSFSVDSCFLGSTALGAVAGETYNIVVAAFSGLGGTLELSVDVVQPPELQLGVDRIGRFHKRTGAATVTGTVTCTAGEWPYIEGSLSQRVGRRRTITGNWFTVLNCGDGTPQRWSVSLQPSRGKFKGGRANVNAYASLCNPIDCVSDSVERTIKLRRSRLGRR